VGSPEGRSLLARGGERAHQMDRGEVCFNVVWTRPSINLRACFGGINPTREKAK
jgi:hypothetical protein